MVDSTRLIKFYSGSAPDDKGRFFSQILEWDYGLLENIHNYIQWLFPLTELSAFNLTAPILTTDDIKIFQNSAELKENLLKAFNLMLGFYGFQQVGSKIERASNYKERIHNWVSYGNHNYLRITRILKCLCTLGLQQYAQAFLSVLDNVFSENHDKIGNSYLYWKKAVKEAT